MNLRELKRTYRAILYRTKKYGWAKREELIKKGYSEEAINQLIISGLVYEPRPGFLRPT